MMVRRFGAPAPPHEASMKKPTKTGDHGNPRMSKELQSAVDTRSHGRELTEGRCDASIVCAGPTYAASDHALDDRHPSHPSPTASPSPPSPHSQCHRLNNYRV